MNGLERQAQAKRDRATARPRTQAPYRPQPSGQGPAQDLAAESPGQGYRTGPDLRRMPKNYDPDVWNLTLAFMDQAEKYGVELEVSIWRTYALLLDRISKAKGRKRLRDRENWAQIVEMMIIEFWENDVDLATEAWAINQFCGVETFRGLAGWAIRKLAPEPEGRVHSWERPEGSPRMAPRTLHREPRAYTEEEEAELRARARVKIAELRKELGYE